MVNTLSGSVSAYRKEIVKPRFIRIDEVMALLDVTRDEAMDIALAAGARYQLAKIILVHKERLMKFMKHFARVPSSNKIVEKKFVRIGEASMTYSIGHHRFIEMARAAGAVYKIGTAKGKAVLAPMKAVKKMLVTMELHLDASIDKLDNMAMNVQLDKEKHMENAKVQEQTEPERAEAERVEAEIVYSPMVAEPQEYQYNADAFEARGVDEVKQEAAYKETAKVREDKAR